MPLAYSYVRFSTPEQAKGDSLRRQVDDAKAYCREHGLTLDSKLSLRDLGVSGFRGENAVTGALGTFMEAIVKKKVAPGSILIVESLDRLSRAQIADSLELLLRIIRHGVEVVSLMDKMRFNSTTINENPTALMISLMTFHRAHDESATKSVRVSKAWKNKRQNAGSKKLTARAPAWLQLAPDRKIFLVRPERAVVIRRIFKMTIAGHGRRAIVAKFNDEKLPTWGGGNGWHDSYLQKILSNPAVIGIYQPHHLVNGKREPTGDPVAGYYPVVIDANTFAKVQHRGVRPHGGPVGSKVTNLFTKLVICGFTGETMRYVDKGTEKRGKDRWRYLSNDGKRLGNPHNSISYPTFEAAFLGYVRHIDWDDLRKEGKSNDQADEIRGRIVSAQAQITDTKARIRKLIAIAATAENPPKSILSSITELEDAEERITASIQRLHDELNKVEAETRPEDIEGTPIAELAANATDYDTRLQLREEIRRKVKRITIYGRFTAKNPKGEIRTNPNPAFEILFHNGVTRHVSLKDFMSTTAAFTLEIKGEQNVWINHPVEESNPKPFAAGPPPKNNPSRKSRK